MLCPPANISQPVTYSGTGKMAIRYFRGQVSTMRVSMRTQRLLGRALKIDAGGRVKDTGLNRKTACKVMLSRKKDLSWSHRELWSSANQFGVISCNRRARTWYLCVDWSLVIGSQEKGCDIGWGESFGRGNLDRITEGFQLISLPAAGVKDLYS